MKTIPLDPVKTIPFKDDFILVAMSKDFLRANDGKQLVFDVKLTLDGKLKLCASLSKLSHNSKDVDTIET